MSRADLLERYLPEYDVSDSVACVVDADVATTWAALIEADLIEVGRKHPLIAVLGFARLLPELAADLLHGEARGPTRAPAAQGDDRATHHQGRLGLVGRARNDELALGLVGKFWRPVIEVASLEVEEFRSFSQPGWAKTVYDMRVSRIDKRRTLLSGTMRTATTDGRSRRWFRRYWTFGVGSGAHILVEGLLDLVRDQAEATAGTVEPVAAGV